MTDSTNDEARLLAAIAANPEDDAPRLEYGRLLRERNDPRGEFIHVDYALARRSLGLSIDSIFNLHVSDRASIGRLPSYDLNELRDWRLRLLEEHEKSWSAPLIQAGAKDVSYARGFPEGMHVDAESFPARAKSLFQLGPTIRNLVLDRSNLDEDLNEIKPATPCPRELASAIAATPELGRVQELSLFGVNCWGDNAIKTILDSPHLGSLRVLDLSASHVGPDGIEAALRPDRLPELKGLILSNNDVGVEHARRIAQLTSLPPKLRVLDLSETALGDAGAEWLAKAPALAGLKELRVASSGVGVKGTKSLLDSEHLKNTLITVSTRRFPDNERHRIEALLRKHNDTCLAR